VICNEPEVCCAPARRRPTADQVALSSAMNVAGALVPQIARSRKRSRARRRGSAVYRLEWKKAVRRTKKVANTHVFQAVIARDSAQPARSTNCWGFSAAGPRFPKAHARRSA
jgi:hypothetical protein